MDGMHGYGVPPEPVRSQGGGRIRVLVSVALVAFVITLAVVIGQRLSDQAMAVLSGAVCGVAASIPTSLLIVWVTRRRQEPRPMQTMPGVYPPVVVVQPPPQTGMPNAYQPGYLAPYAPPAQREFTVVGGEFEEVGYGSGQ